MLQDLRGFQNLGGLLVYPAWGPAKVAIMGAWGQPLKVEKMEGGLWGWGLQAVKLMGRQGTLLIS